MTAIGAWLDQHWDHAEHAVMEHIPHHHDTSQAPAQTPVTVETAAHAAQPQGEPVALIQDIQTGLTDFASRLSALADNPVVDSLLAAEHVPPEAFAIVVKTIDGLEELYNPATPAPAAPAPADAAPAQ